MNARPWEPLARSLPDCALRVRSEPRAGCPAKAGRQKSVPAPLPDEVVLPCHDTSMELALVELIGLLRFIW